MLHFGTNLIGPNEPTASCVPTYVFLFQYLPTSKWCSVVEVQAKHGPQLKITHLKMKRHQVKNKTCHNERPKLRCVIALPVIIFFLF
jgi:hypothetical protein